MYIFYSTHQALQIIFNYVSDNNSNVFSDRVHFLGRKFNIFCFFFFYVSGKRPPKMIVRKSLKKSLFSFAIALTDTNSLHNKKRRQLELLPLI